MTGIPLDSIRMTPDMAQRRLATQRATVKYSLPISGG